MLRGDKAPLVEIVYASCDPQKQLLFNAYELKIFCYVIRERRGAQDSLEVKVLKENRFVCIEFSNNSDMKMRCL